MHAKCGAAVEVRIGSQVRISSDHGRSSTTPDLFDA
jgi:hypothetical protein